MNKKYVAIVLGVVLLLGVALTFGLNKETTTASSEKVDLEEASFSAGLNPDNHLCPPYCDGSLSCQCPD